MVRVDAWVWAVRLLKTRSQAASACRAGHIKVNGVAVKPAQHLEIGDRVRVWAHHRERIVEVQELLSKRVGASVAETAYIDHSPPPPPKETIASMPRRAPGAGRPTKKERREMEKFRNMR